MSESVTVKESTNTSSSKPVSIETKTLSEVFEMKLSIPDYQRKYCWLEENVYKLMDDIWNINQTYHLGSIILQVNNGNYDIVDGQQRLITLTLILRELGEQDINLPLLSQKIESEEAKKYIAYNSYLINSYIKGFNLGKEDKETKIKNIKNNLQLTILTLCSSSSLDLAYTFFSNQNSKGKSLTDYDLLKVHHLRYIPNENEEQAMHLAKGWDAILRDGDSVDTTLGLYLFRMRKWLYSRRWYDKERFKVKKEFEAADIIEEIPPFGEQFKFNEPIQRGTHFFAYTDIFIKRCKNFKNTETFKIIQKLDGDSHYQFRQVMEALLFSYYLKFGDSYLAEAFICISAIISLYRIDVSRINVNSLINLEKNYFIMQWIEQATSPTFFLKMAKNYYNNFKLEPIEIKDGIKGRYFNRLKEVYEGLKPFIVSKTIKEYSEKIIK